MNKSWHVIAYRIAIFLSKILPKNSFLHLTRIKQKIPVNYFVLMVCLKLAHFLNERRSKRRLITSTLPKE